MTITLAVDPGIRGCGAALFRESGELFAASYVRNPSLSGASVHDARRMAQAVREWSREFVREQFTQAGRALTPHSGVTCVVCEFPKVYTQGKLKGDPSDLLPLAAVDGAIAALFDHADAFSYLPREWKGTLDKSVTQARLFGYSGNVGILSLTEQNTIQDQGALTHNTLDAVALGLFHLGRFKPKRVVVR